MGRDGKGWGKHEMGCKGGGWDGVQWDGDGMGWDGMGMGMGMGRLGSRLQRGDALAGIKAGFPLALVAFLAIAYVTVLCGLTVTGKRDLMQEGWTGWDGRAG